MAKGSGLKAWMGGGILASSLLLTACSSDSNPTSTPKPNYPQVTSHASAPAFPSTPTVIVGTPTPGVALPPAAPTTQVAPTLAATNTPLVPGLQGGSGQANTSNSINLPIYPNLKPSNPGQPLEQRFTANLIGSKESGEGGQSAPGSASFFTTSSNFGDVLAFYDKTLTAEGYKKIGQQNLNAIGSLKLSGASLVAYGKNSNSDQVVIINAGLVTENFIAQLNTPELTNLNLNRGDQLIIILNHVPLGLG